MFIITQINRMISITTEKQVLVVAIGWGFAKMNPVSTYVDRLTAVWPRSENDQAVELSQAPEPSWRGSALADATG